MFTLTSVTKQSSIRLGDETYGPLDGRRYVRVCGSVQAGDEYDTNFGSPHDYVVTDTGLGFADFDDDTENWRDIGIIPAGAIRSACEVWDVPAHDYVVVVAVNNWLDTPAFYWTPLQ